MSFYGVSVSVNGGGIAESSAPAAAAATGAGYGEEKTMEEAEDAPRCRRCPALRPDTAYTVYVAAEDDDGATAYNRVNNLAPTVAVLRLKTAKTTPPSWSGGHPAVSDVAHSSATLEVGVVRVELCLTRVT